MSKTIEQFTINQIEELLSRVLEKMFPLTDFNDGHMKWAKAQIGRERDPECPFNLRPLKIERTDFLNHFLQRPTEKLYGAIYCRPTNKSDRVNFFWLEAICEESLEELKSKVLPLLDKYNFAFIIEHHRRGSSLWFFCDTTISILKKFISNISTKAGVDLQQKDRFRCSLDFADEQFMRKGNCKKILGGLKKPFPNESQRIDLVEFEGNKGCDPVFIMQSIIDCKPITEESMCEVIKKPLNIDFLYQLVS